MKLILLVGLGGGIGAILRYLTSKGAGALLGANFPYGTLIVNILGSMLMGFLVPILLNRYDHYLMKFAHYYSLDCLEGLPPFLHFPSRRLISLKTGNCLKDVLIFSQP